MNLLNAMKRKSSLTSVLLLASLSLAGTTPALAAFPPLPVPLKLPQSLFQVLPVDKEGSFMGDAVRITDCPKNTDNPLGTCGAVQFGGVALYNSHLSGPIQVRFSPPVNNISHFEISHPFDLTGPDVVMRAPQLYLFGATKNAVLDSFNNYSSGNLNLLTGEVTNLNYQVIMFNIFYGALGLVNPKLKAPVFTFPGTYGSADIKFEQRADGLLDLTFYGSTFLPLGNNINGDPVRLPMPFCGPNLQCASIQVPGMSLHPHLRITTKPTPPTPSCGNLCPDIQPNTVIETTLNARFSSIGDDFKLNIPQLGGEGIGRSQMQGRIILQFGDRTGDYVPVSISAQPPSGLVVPPPPFPVPGLSLGFVGHDEKLRFPNATYDVKEVAITDDPFDIPVGEYNMRTGQFIGDTQWRTFWNQDVLLAILAQNNGRLIPASFFLKGPAKIQKGPNNSVVFRYDGTEFRPFDGFVFPNPDVNNAAISYTAGPGSILTPFFKMQSVLSQDSPVQTMTGSQNNVLSSFGETFSYSYQVPCNAPGQPASFSYTNTATGKSGGAFKMDNLVAVSCINSLTSKLGAGNYDTINFTGFGSWSKDADDGLHVVTVQVSTAADAPYISISVDGGVSVVNTKPAEIPVP
ncbi:MAG: hypothetical protein EBY17_06130 [Acidobacteriia bacterium]|nr:hypothetical protein [Terriglobia bacterium]